MTTLFHEKFGPRTTGYLRILFFGLLFFIVNTDGLTVFSSERLAGLNLFCPSTMGVQWPVTLTMPVAKLTGYILKFSLLTAALGLFARASYWTAFFSLSLLTQNALKFCYSNHDLFPLHVAILIWAIADSDSAFRISRFRRGQDEPRPGFSSGSTLLIQLMRFHFIAIFFASGLAKLRIGGMDWIFSDSLRNILLVQNYAYEGSWPNTWFLKINSSLIEMPVVSRLLAGLTVVVEILAPVAAVNRRFTGLVVLHLAFMQVGILFSMYIGFYAWGVLYLCWISPLAAERVDNQFLRVRLAVQKNIRVQKIMQKR